ncbi:LuxR C-terminal-related transcriptional regulator [Frankia sp. QA3]|uniref:helix-turn-helix transcriptional regulator n=1 Tax=Frankia sp. QA3 TaxID=710111 RepID=UPI000A013B26|nr:LuxR C-terminal-related transcriptional regulator [Frankia sp. QA3]
MGESRITTQWLDLMADLLETPTAELPVGRISEQLRITFEVRGVAYHHRTSGGPLTQGMYPVEEQFAGHRRYIDRWSIDDAVVAHPLLRFYLATRQSRPLQVLDVPERFADRHVMGAWRDLGSSWGVASQAAIPLHFGRDSHRAFVIGRADPFTPDELALLRTLHRLLCVLDRHVSVLRAVESDPRARGGARDVRLSPRETAALRLAADGMTAAAAGRRLGIAESTVHKHLERAYRKLGARDRVTAVLRAQEMGLLPPQPGDVSSTRRPLPRPASPQPGS